MKLPTRRFVLSSKDFAKCPRAMGNTGRRLGKKGARDHKLWVGIALCRFVRGHCRAKVQSSDVELRDHRDIKTGQDKQGGTATKKSGDLVHIGLLVSTFRSPRGQMSSC